MMDSPPFGSTGKTSRLLIGAAALLLLAPSVSIVAVLIGADNEVSYDYGIMTSSCPASAPTCYTVLQLEVGNTGTRQQDLVEIDLRDFPSWRDLGHRSIKIVASTELLVEPRVSIDQERRKIRIAPLAANQMVQFGFLVHGRVDRDTLESLEPTVQAQGRVTRTSPKATALARAFRTVLSFFI